MKRKDLRPGTVFVYGDLPFVHPYGDRPFVHPYFPRFVVWPAHDDGPGYDHVSGVSDELDPRDLDELDEGYDGGVYADCDVTVVWEPEPGPAKTKKVFYLAHPVSGDHVGNAFRAVEWIRWFSQNVPHLIVVAPWVAEVLAYPTKVPEGQVGSWDWALANDETVVRKLDGVITVGGRVSPGMQREVDACLANGGTYVDMSRFAIPGDVPEDFFIDEDI